MAYASLAFADDSPSGGILVVPEVVLGHRDDLDLNYEIVRNGTVVHTATVASTFWDRPTVSFLDTGLTAGQSYNYRVWVRDPDGNTAVSNLTPVTVASAGPACRSRAY